MDRGRWLAVLAVVGGPPAVADTPEDQAPEPNLAMLKVWAEYAKERFKAADTLIGEYRSWARQLVAAIGVVIGLEVTLLVRLALDGGSPLHASWRVLCLVVFFGMLGLQFWTLHRLLVVGYKSQPVVGPESPSVLANYVAERDEAEAYRLTGAYYAKACDRFHELSELLGERVARATVTFQWTLVALLLGVALVAGGALWPLVAPDRRASMADEAASTPSGSGSAVSEAAPAPAAPAPQASPTTHPLVTTPTDGQVMRKSEQGGKLLRDER